MRNIYAGNQVPKGSYICANCGEEQIICEKSLLPVCKNCGCDEFKATILLDLTPDEINEKVSECIKLLAISSYLFEKHQREEFLNVMSINLRILLCDGEGALLPKVISNLSFNKAIFNKKENLVFPEDLFGGHEKINLDEFLSQVIVRREGKKSITLGKIIRSVANKCGGAHVDLEIAEDFYLASSVSKHYFVVLSKYVINLAGFDYDSIITDFLNSLKI